MVEPKERLGLRCKTLGSAPADLQRQRQGISRLCCATHCGPTLEGRQIMTHETGEKWLVQQIMDSAKGRSMITRRHLLITAMSAGSVSGMTTSAFGEPVALRDFYPRDGSFGRGDIDPALCPCRTAWRMSWDRCAGGKPLFANDRRKGAPRSVRKQWAWSFRISCCSKSLEPEAMRPVQPSFARLLHALTSVSTQLKP